MKWGRINITKLVRQSNTGSCDSLGSYDGFLGDLQRNLTDVSFIGNVYESLCSHHPWPAEIVTIFGQDAFHFFSSPRTNVTTEFKQLHQSFYVFSPTFLILFAFIFIACIILISRARKKQKIVRKTWDKPRKLTMYDHYIVSFWNLLRITLRQDYEILRFTSTMSRLIITSFMFVMLAIYIAFSGFINTDLVKYSDVIFIENIHDVIESGIPIKFATASSALSILKSAPKGSEHAYILETALASVNHDEKKIQYDSEDPLGPGEEIVNHRMITILHDFPIEIMRYFECIKLSIESDLTFESRLYKSKEMVFEVHPVIFASHYASVKLKERIRKIFQSTDEGGLFDSRGRNGYQTVAEGVMGSDHGVISCLNTKYWIKKGQHVSNIRIEHCYQIFFNILILSSIGAIILIFEKIHRWCCNQLQPEQNPLATKSVSKRVRSY